MKQSRRAVPNKKPTSTKNSARSKTFLFAFSSASIFNTVPIAVQRCWTCATRRLAALEVHTFQNCDLIGFPPPHPFSEPRPDGLLASSPFQTMSRFRHQKKPEQAYLAHPHQIAQLWRIASTRVL